MGGGRVEGEGEGGGGSGRRLGVGGYRSYLTFFTCQSTLQSYELDRFRVHFADLVMTLSVVTEICQISKYVPLSLHIFPLLAVC